MKKPTTKTTKSSTNENKLTKGTSKTTPQMSLQDYHNYKLIIPLKKGTAHENLHDVLYVEIKNQNVHICIDDKITHKIDRTMAQILEQFPEPHFQQTHEAYIANMHHVEKYLPGETDTLILKGNKIIPISRSNKEKIANALKAFSKTIPPKIIKKKKP